MTNEWHGRRMDMWMETCTSASSQISGTREKRIRSINQWALDRTGDEMRKSRTNEIDWRMAEVLFLLLLLLLLPRYCYRQKYTPSSEWKSCEDKNLNWEKPNATKKRKEKEGEREREAEEKKERMIVCASCRRELKTRKNLVSCLRVVLHNHSSSSSSSSSVAVASPRSAERKSQGRRRCSVFARLSFPSERSLERVRRGNSSADRFDVRKRVNRIREKKLWHEQLFNSEGRTSENDHYCRSVNPRRIKNALDLADQITN